MPPMETHDKYNPDCKIAGTYEEGLYISLIEHLPGLMPPWDTLDHTTKAKLRDAGLLFLKASNPRMMQYAQSLHSVMLIATDIIAEAEESGALKDRPLTTKTGRALLDLLQAAYIAGGIAAKELDEILSERMARHLSAVIAEHHRNAMRTAALFDAAFPLQPEGRLI